MLIVFIFLLTLYPIGVYNVFGDDFMSKECDRCKKLVHRSREEKQSYIKRLNRIEGQVRGINKMVDEDRHCDDIMIQISAVSNALKSLGQEILLNHMKTCMVEDINNKKYDTIDEVMDLCRRMM